MYRYMLLLVVAMVSCMQCFADPLTYVIVDTGQTGCYDNFREIAPPQPGDAFNGQDAQVQGKQPSYRDNGDGTITDVNTGLTWVKARGEKVTWDAAMAGAAQCRVGGFTDWRMPTIKELYSLINFNGYMRGPENCCPYIDTRYFDFVYGNAQAGERPIDSQDWTATQYVGTTMLSNATVFGVNFADGRIKGYPKLQPGPRGGQHMLYVRYVRGNPQYGINHFADNHDGTITDQATGLMWQQADNGKPCNWQDALAYANTLALAGHHDWRLPNAKELQSIVDYTRAPAVTHSAAIDPIFSVTDIESYFWTGTTHLDGPPPGATAAIYVAFGRALGYMQVPPGSGNIRLLDVHGAGAQRSDPKTGNPADFPTGRGPQGDVIRIFNYVRCVRDAR